MTSPCTGRFGLLDRGLDARRIVKAKGKREQIFESIRASTNA